MGRVILFGLHYEVNFGDCRQQSRSECQPVSKLEGTSMIKSSCPTNGSISTVKFLPGVFHLSMKRLDTLLEEFCPWERLVSAFMSSMSSTAGSIDTVDLNFAWRKLVDGR